VSDNVSSEEYVVLEVYNVLLTSVVSSIIIVVGEVLCDVSEENTVVSVDVIFANI
jgi:hypothetical protein